MDIIGDIAVIKFSDNVKAVDKKKKAEQILKKQKNIKSVYEKKEKIKGRLRKFKVRWLAGIKKTETIFKESGCLFKINIEKCYFSPRLSNDRLEIARKIKKSERVFVMFSGIAPYAIIIGKRSKAREVIAIELSKSCNKYAKENVKLNKISNIKIIQGDVKRKVNKKLGSFDRIIMPRPQLKETFLKQAFLISKKNTIIHFYDFLTIEEIKGKKYKDKIEEEAKKTKKRFKIISFKKTREIAPYKYHVRVDVRVLG